MNFYGCSQKTESLPQDSSSDLSESETQETSETQESSQAPEENHDETEIVRNIKPADGTYVYDNAKVLSADEFNECNDYTGWLYETFLINAAVVTADSIEGMTPEAYAEKCYVDIYSGRGSGLLLLINNDTNVDYLYKTGSCIVSIDEGKQSEEFYWATQDIIAGNYKDAILRIMKLGEACPQHVFDNGGVFTSEQIAALENLCSSGTKEVSILATSNTTGSSNEEICRSYYDRHYKDSEGYMIMLDTESNSLVVVSDAEIPEAVVNALETANAAAAEKDYNGALTTVINALQG